MWMMCLPACLPHGAWDFKRIFFKTSVLLMTIKFLIQLPLHFRNSQEFKYIKILFMLPEFTFPSILYVFFQSCQSIIHKNIKFSWTYKDLRASSPSPYLYISIHHKLARCHHFKYFQIEIRQETNFTWPLQSSCRTKTAEKQWPAQFYKPST